MVFLSEMSGERPKILNLTIHRPTPDQIKVGVVEPSPNDKDKIVSLLSFSSLPMWWEVEERAEKLADLAYALIVELSGGFYPSDQSWGAVMIGGAPYLMPPLQRALLKRGLKPLYAFSRREVVEEAQADGSVKKSIIFKHIGWIRVPAEA